MNSPFLARAVNLVRRFLAFDLVSCRRISRMPVELLGSSECGWIVPVGLPKEGALCFCFGAGEDITFDIALAHRRLCLVHTFDPTPRAISHHASLPVEVRNEVTFHPVGIWKENRTMQFYAPAAKEHVSHSLVSLQSDTVGFAADCRTLGRLIEEIGSGPPELIKMDIEGAEMHVINDLLQTAPPHLLLVEFDELTPLASTANWRRVRDVVTRIIERGYEIYALDRTNYCFIRRFNGDAKNQS